MHPTIKRLLILALLLALCLPGSLPALAEPMQASNILLGDYMNTLAAFDGKLYGLGGEGLYLLDPVTGEGQLLSQDPGKGEVTDDALNFRVLEGLFADEEGLLGYNPYEQTLERIDVNASPASKKTLLKVDGELLSSMSNLAYKAPYFFGFHFGERKLYRVDTLSGEVHSFQVNEVRGIAPGEDGLLYGIESKQDAGVWTWLYCSYDIKNGVRAELAQTTERVGFTMAYDAASKTLYSADNTQILYWQQGQAEILPLSHIPRGDAYGMVLIGSDQAAVIVDGELVAIRPLDKDAVGSAQALYLMDPIGRASQYYPFLRTHGQVDLVFLTPGVQTAEERFATDTLTKAPEADIYVLSQQNLLGQIKKKGFALDMAGNAGIEALYQALEPAYKNAFGQDGKILALPKEAHVESPVYAPAILEKLGLTPPTTYLEYFQMAETFLKEHQEAHPEIHFEPFGIGLDLTSVLREVTAELEKNGQPLDYEAPEIRQLVAQMAKVARLPVQTNPEATEWMIYAYSFMYLPEGWAYMPLKLKAENSRAMTIPESNLEYFVINPYSRNAETALKFLESYADNLSVYYGMTVDTRYREGIEQVGYQQTLAQMDEQIKGFEEALKGLDGAEKTQMEQTIAQEKAAREEYMETGRWQFSPETVARVREHMQEAYIPAFNPITMLVAQYPDFFEEYRTNPLFDVDKFLSQLNQMVNTARIEQE